MIGTWEIILILCVILLLFGGKKLPELAKNLGKGIREFKKATSGLDEDSLEETCSCEKPEHLCCKTQNEDDHLSK